MTTPIVIVDQSDANKALKINADGTLNAKAIADYVRAGQSFTATIDLLNAAANTNNYPLGIFNPANSGVNVLIYSIQIVNGASAATALVKRITSAPGYTSSTAARVTNDLHGGTASAIASNVTTSTTSQTLPGTYDQVSIVVGNTTEMLTNGASILLPSGSAHGISVYIQTYAAGFNSITARWIEYA